MKMKGLEAQFVEHLPSKYETTGSISSNTKKNWNKTTSVLHAQNFFGPYFLNSTVQKLFAVIIILSIIIYYLL
jgi:hypothetical protein